MKSGTRVAVFTGTRAEYGLLAPLLRLIQQHEGLELYLLVSGTHLSHLHGYTIERIIEDGFIPDARLESILASDTAQSVCKALALTVMDVGAEIDRSQCDYLVVLGDRFEAFAAATAAVVHGVPVVHLHGGEASEGAIDERFRNAITKLADLHFVAGDEFAQRVRQMGEPDDRVFVCGPAVQDVLASLATVNRSDLEQQLGALFKPLTALVVYHPATAGAEDPAGAVASIIDGVLGAGVELVFVSQPNADEGSAAVARAIESRAAEDDRILTFSSVGQITYLSLLRECDLIVGNSSSGIIEAPLLGTPTVNVGSRQDGRPRAESVIDVAPDSRLVREACLRAIRSKAPADAMGQSPYRLGVSMAEKVISVLLSVEPGSLTAKRFTRVDSEPPQGAVVPAPQVQVG
jgi:UDP-hydrolysing UDP-N-acetyl-D-glucosamine 2-epimerase